MLRFLVRHGIVRVVGRRAVPVLLIWDVAILANKARQIPIVDRSLRRGAAAAADRFAATLDGLAPRSDLATEDEEATDRQRRTRRPRRDADADSAPPDYRGSGTGSRSTPC